MEFGTIPLENPPIFDADAAITLEYFLVLVSRLWSSVFTIRLLCVFLNIQNDKRIHVIRVLFHSEFKFQIMLKSSALGGFVPLDVIGARSL